jgi:uncharacterized membrane protein HdeD (DUF308 family)
MNSNPSDNPSNEIDSAAHELARLKKEWWAFLLLGLLLILGGTACISYPFFTTVGVMVFQGVALMLAGVAIIISAFWTGRWSAFMLQLLFGLLYLVAGFIIADAPIASAAIFTLLLAGFLVVGGVFRIVFSLMERFPQWGWVMLNGIISLAAGVIIFKSFRKFAEGESASILWIIGLIVGVELIFYGWSWVMLSFSVKNIPDIEATSSDA